MGQIERCQIWTISPLKGERFCRLSNGLLICVELLSTVLFKLFLWIGNLTEGTIWEKGPQMDSSSVWQWDENLGQIEKVLDLNHLSSERGKVLSALKWTPRFCWTFLHCAFQMFLWIGSLTGVRFETISPLHLAVSINLANIKVKSESQVWSWNPLGKYNLFNTHLFQDLWQSHCFRVTGE